MRRVLARSGMALRADHAARARRAASAGQLRHSLSFYDALYLALAESLNSPLVTAGARIARAQPDHPLILPILHSK